MTKTFFFRIITKTGMQSLIQHSVSQMMPTVKNGTSKNETPIIPAAPEAGCPEAGAGPPPLAPITSGMAGGNVPPLAGGHVTNLFDPTSYRSVHNLATNTDKRNFEDLMKKTAEAIFMARCLKFNGFFGDGEEDHR